jgi:hypothetical protein
MVAPLAHPFQVERRMALQQPRGETVADYKARLRRTAMNIPAATIRKAVDSIRVRALAVIEAALAFAGRLAFLLFLSGSSVATNFGLAYLRLRYDT